MIYLDNCATTRLRKEVVDIMQKSMIEDFGNPSSLHRLGMKSEQKIKIARSHMANFLNVDSNEIYFTSGGTESNNMAIQSIINKMKKRGNHIITTEIEHPSVLNIMKNYEQQGFDITYLNVDNQGYISLEELKDSIKDDTILVSIMHINNEIGSIQPISKVKEIIKKINPNTLFHVDGIQSFGKVELALKKWEVDCYSFSGHKVHGPKGIGGLFIDKKHSLVPLIFGGNQERGLRSGTENLIGIIGFGEAVKVMNENHKVEANYVRELKEYFAKKVEEEIPYIKFNTSLDENSSPYIINISFNHVKGEILLHYLEDKEIYVSTTSACSSKGTDKSHVLKSIGLKNEEIEGSLRFCFSYENKKEDLDYTLKILKDSVEDIRQITMR